MKNNYKKDIIFVSSPKNANSRVLPFFYLYLSAWLDKEGINSDIIDIKSDKFFKSPVNNHEENSIINKIIRQLKLCSPLAIGLSCFTPEYNTVMNLAKRIKNTINTKIIVGNAHATIMPEDFIYPGSPIDFAVIGEGEITLTELIQAIKNDQSFDRVKGIAFLKEGTCYLTPPRPLIRDLSKLPLPTYHKVNMGYYLKPNIMLIRNLFLSGVHIYTGRGCPYKCTFCAANTIWRRNELGSTIVRYKPIEKVIENIEYLVNKYHIDGFYILDDTFTINRKRVFVFFNEYTKMGFDLVWSAQTRGDLLDEEMVKALKRSGCIQLDLGVESGSQEVLNRIKKGIKIEDIRNAFALCRKHRMGTYATIMINNPSETKDDIKKTEELVKEIKATRYGISICTPYPGTEIYDEYIGDKLSKDSYHLLTNMRLFFKVNSIFKLTKDVDVEKTMFKLRKKFFTIKSFNHFTTNTLYWQKILNSKRKWLYFSSWYEFTRERLKETFLVIIK
jgi:radical SAM superfamily enzyme YgiQ (UPF0313 family)